MGKLGSWLFVGIIVAMSLGATTVYASRPTLPSSEFVIAQIEARQPNDPIKQQHDAASRSCDSANGQSCLEHAKLMQDDWQRVWMGSIDRGGPQPNISAWLSSQERRIVGVLGVGCLRSQFMPACTQLARVTFRAANREGVAQRDACAPRAFACLEAVYSSINPKFQRATSLADKACQAGDGEGCLVLADFQYTGRGVDRNMKAVRANLLRGCQLGVVKSCLVESFAAYLDGDSQWILANYRRDLASRCDGGNQITCLIWIDALQRGIGGPAQITRASEVRKDMCVAFQVKNCELELLSDYLVSEEGSLTNIGSEFLCVSGNSYECYEGISDALSPFFIQDWTQARWRPRLTTLCEAKNTTACFSLGELLSDQRTGAIDLVAARQAYGVACSANPGDRIQSACDAIQALRERPSGS
jgi:hypothetical protein